LGEVWSFRKARTLAILAANGLKSINVHQDGG
jgi:hypothetical protein